MKSKRAMIELRNTERRLRRELKKNPPSRLSKWFDTILKWAQRLFLLSFFVIALFPILLLIPGPEDTDLILFAAERTFTFLLFGILVIGCLVGTRAIVKPTNDSSGIRKKPDGRRTQIMKAVLLLFFALVFILSAIVCWGQLKSLSGAWQSLLS